MVERIRECDPAPMADAAFAGLMRPSGIGYDAAIVRAAFEKYLHRNVGGRRVLFVGREPRGEALGNGMFGVGDFDVEALERTVTDVPAADELEIFATLRIHSHRVVQVQERLTTADKIGYRFLLIRIHPDAHRALSASGPHHAVAEDDEQIDFLEVLARESAKVDGEMRFETLDGREGGSQSVFEVFRLVVTVTDEDQRVFARWVEVRPVERRTRRGEFSMWW